MSTLLVAAPAIIQERKRQMRVGDSGAGEVSSVSCVDMKEHQRQITHNKQRCTWLPVPVNPRLQDICGAHTRYRPNT